MINNVVLVGRMTKDPELRRTQSAKAVTSFTLAVDKGFTQQDGQSADFIYCVVWNKSAESVEKYTSKGSLVGIEGRLNTRSYENNQGNKVYVTEVICNNVTFLDSKKKEENQSVVSNFDIDEEDIQF